MDNNVYLTQAEGKLADIIWREAPLTSPDLVALAHREFSWKKSTTYTVLKKLCNKGVFKNENTNILVVLTRTEQMTRQSRRYVEDTFGGSLPGFITAFIGAGNLSPEKVDELRRLIDALDEVD